MHALAIIPARRGSKRLPGKNTRDLCGKPLIAWTIHAALACAEISKVVVTTDDPAAAVEAEKHRVTVITRPPELATDTAPTLAAVKHALNVLRASEQYEPDVLVVLQPTSPLRTGEDITLALQQFSASDADSLVSVSESNPYWSLRSVAGRIEPIFGWDMFHRCKQNLPVAYAPNGAIYVTTPCALERNGSFYNERTQLAVMPVDRSVDIDEETDFLLAEFLLRRRCCTP